MPQARFSFSFERDLWDTLKRYNAICKPFSAGVRCCPHASLSNSASYI